MDILGLFCKVPTGDSTDWLMLPYGARGLLLQLWRKVGHDGRLELGRYGLRGVAGHVGALADWPAVEVDLKALLDAGAVIHHVEAGQLEIVGYVEHQGAYARTKAAERMRRKREQRPNVGEQRGTSANKSEHVRTCSTEEKRREEIKDEIREDPPKSPIQVLPLDFWGNFVARCGSRWGLPEKLARHCAGLGLVVPMPEHSQLIEGGRQALIAGHSEQELMQLATWIAGGGMSWHKGGVWRYVSQHFIAVLADALSWDGKSPIDRKWPPARAPAPDVDQSDDVLTRFEKGPRR